MFAYALTSAVAVALIFVTLILLSGLTVISENQSGLVVKKFGPPLPAGRQIALNGEAGYQADMLPPGWHFGFFPWKYRIDKIPVIQVRPGEIALVVAADGQSIPSERILAKEVECGDFQNARAFIENAGEKGRQLGFLTAGLYRINPALFQLVTTGSAAKFGMEPADLEVASIAPDQVGIVTTLDGKPIAQGDLAGRPVEGHDSFQCGQAFVNAGGCRGLQEQVLLSGSWNLNPWFVKVDCIAMTQIPIGYVGVVVSYVGREHLDISGDDFTHGDLVEKGRKGVWNEPLLPGKHPINARVMKVELVPTTNIVLNWTPRVEQHKYDEKLAPITVRSKDGFSFTIDVSQIIHVGMKQAPRVISRVGSMQNLVDHVLQPTVANYFRNSAQQVTVLDFLGERTQRQSEAFDAILTALQTYDVECIDTLIGDIQAPPELMKTQTDRKIAEELQRTYEVQRMAQVQRQLLERETSIANMQGEVVRSEQMVAISQKNALALAEQAKGQASAIRAKAEAEAVSTRLSGEAEADATRQIGAAKAQAYQGGVLALGNNAFTAIQLAGILGEHHVKLVPDIALSSGGSEGGASALALAMMAKLMPRPDQAPE